MSRKREKRPISIAPMMEHTNRFYRYFIRQITRKTWLYTEMITTGAILHGDRKVLLGFDEVEKPLTLQLGGAEPLEMAECARIAEDWNYDEVNINVGCPSDRVQSGNFGACLMAQPELVGRCIEKMRGATGLPITVKHRIGIDGRQSYEDLQHFVRTTYDAGCERFIVHARIARLDGLSAKENREIPPLRYDDVYRLKEDLPDAIIEINGGVRDFSAVQDQLSKVDGVMIGRAAIENPYLFAEADSKFHGANDPASSREQVLLGCIDYLEQMIAAGHPPHRFTRHVLPLYFGQPGGRHFRRFLSARENRTANARELVTGAIEAVRAVAEQPQEASYQV